MKIRSIVFIIGVWLCLSSLAWADTQTLLKTLGEMQVDFSMLSLCDRVPHKRGELHQKILKRLCTRLDLGEDPDPMVKNQIQQLAQKIAGFLELLIKNAETLEQVELLSDIVGSNWVSEGTREPLLNLLAEARERVATTIRRKERSIETHAVNVTSADGTRLVLVLSEEHEVWRRVDLGGARDASPEGRYSPSFETH